MRSIRLLGSLLAFVAPFAARAQDAPLLKLTNPNAFLENFLDQPPPIAQRGGVVGATIVGLRVDTPATPFNPSDLRLRTGEARPQANAKLCFKIISRDGRYFAKGQYDPLSASGPTPGITFKTGYGGVLAGYAARDMAPMAFYGANCVEDSGEFVAAQTTMTAPPDRLTVQIRAGEARVRAQLLRGKTPIGKAEICAPYADGPTVGFTGECGIALPAGLTSGPYTLALGETSTSGDIKVKTYNLRMWMDR